MISIEYGDTDGSNGRVAINIPSTDSLALEINIILLYLMGNILFTQFQSNILYWFWFKLSIPLLWTYLVGFLSIFIRYVPLSLRERLDTFNDICVAGIEEDGDHISILVDAIWPSMKADRYDSRAFDAHANSGEPTI